VHRKLGGKRHKKSRMTSNLREKNQKGVEYFHLGNFLLQLVWKMKKKENQGILLKILEVSKRMSQKIIEVEKSCSGSM
jgi:hypothetical protein